MIDRFARPDLARRVVDFPVQDGLGSRRAYDAGSLMDHAVPEANGRVTPADYGTQKSQRRAKVLSDILGRLSGSAGVQTYGPSVQQAPVSVRFGREPLGAGVQGPLRRYSVADLRQNGADQSASVFGQVQYPDSYAINGGFVRGERVVPFQQTISSTLHFGEMVSPTPWNFCTREGTEAADRRVRLLGP